MLGETNRILFSVTFEFFPCIVTNPFIMITKTVEISVLSMEIRYKETNLHIFIPEMKFCHVHSYKASRWGHVCSLGAKWRRPIHDVKVFILYLLDYYIPWMPPFCTQGTHAPSSGSFLTKYLAELHFVFYEVHP